MAAWHASFTSEKNCTRAGGQCDAWHLCCVPSGLVRQRRLAWLQSSSLRGFGAEALGGACSAHLRGHRGFEICAAGGVQVCSRPRLNVLGPVLRCASGELALLTPGTKNVGLALCSLRLHVLSADAHSCLMPLLRFFVHPAGTGAIQGFGGRMLFCPQPGLSRVAWHKDRPPPPTFAIGGASLGAELGIFRCVWGRV